MGIFLSRPHSKASATWSRCLANARTAVQDLRAVNGAAYIQGVVTRPVVLTEIPPAKRAPILKVWCQVATSGRRHLPVPYDAPVSAFEAIAGDYPVFRIDSVTERKPG
jgi:hypothetical protein